MSEAPKPEAKQVKTAAGEEQKSAKAHVHYKNGTTITVIGVRAVVEGRGCYRFEIEQPSKVKSVALENRGKIVTEVVLSCPCAATESAERVINWFIGV